jgi:hypothetical protein
VEALCQAANVVATDSIATRWFVSNESRRALRATTKGRSGLSEPPVSARCPTTQPVVLSNGCVKRLLAPVCPPTRHRRGTREFR